MKKFLLFILLIISLNCSSQNAIGNCSGRIEAKEMPYAQIIGETENEHVLVLIHSKSKNEVKGLTISTSKTLGWNAKSSILIDCA